MELTFTEVLFYLNYVHFLICIEVRFAFLALCSSRISLHLVDLNWSDLEMAV